MNKVFEADEQNIEKQYANRSYQLANALLEQSRETKNKQWEEAIKNLETVQKMDVKNNCNHNRIINIYVQLSEVFLYLEVVEDSHRVINDGEKLLYSLQNKDKIELIRYGFKNINFDEVKLENDILRQKLYFQRACTLEQEGRVKECAQVLTLSIEQGQKYDLETRMKSIQKLISIFSKQTLNEAVPDLMRLNLKINRHVKEIMFMV